MKPIYTKNYLVAEESENYSIFADGETEHEILGEFDNREEAENFRDELEEQNPKKEYIIIEEVESGFDINDGVYKE